MEYKLKLISALYNKIKSIICYFENRFYKFSLLFLKNNKEEVMSAKGSVLKRVRQSTKANARNRNYKSLVKTAIKKVLTENKKEDATKKASDAFSKIDKVAAKGIIHKRKAANQKSRISKHLSTLK